MPKTSKPLPCVLGIVLVLHGLAPAAAGAPAVKMWQEALVIPTYPVGPPQKNPIFYSGRSYQGAKGPIYPYPLYDTLSDTKIDKTYQAIYLENQYVQYIILPELGGRIFAGRDKTNNYDFIYRQHVIKPALIGMIGAWISGGVEWNIPRRSPSSPGTMRTTGSAATTTASRPALSVLPIITWPRARSSSSGATARRGACGKNSSPTATAPTWS